VIVLHAIWSGAVLHLWAEDADTADASLARTRRRRPTRASRPKEPFRQPFDHPFAADASRLRDAMGPTAESAARSDLTLLLPTRGRRPAASPGLRTVEPRSTRTASPRLARWRVSSLALPAAPGLDALLELTSTAPEGVAVGDSVHALARLVLVALDLTARGRVLPGIARDADGRLEARWLPAPDAADAERIRALAEALPPVCLAEARDGSADGQDPAAVARELISAVVDAVARAGLAERRFVSPRGGRRPAARGPAEAFLASLTAADAVIDADPDGLAQLERSLAEWHRSAIPQAGPVRTCFRLVPPDEQGAGDAAPGAPPLDQPGRDRDGAWRIEFLLQAREDPSLLVPAERVWRARSRITALNRTIEHPHEQLLADLGRASRLWPELESALEDAHPTSLQTDVRGAHGFLAEAAPLLEQAGFGVLLPPWWRSRAARLGLRVRARSAQPDRVTTTGLLGLEGLVDYRYEVALGDERLSEAELRELAELKQPLVRVRGRWVELRPDEIEAALRSLETPPADASAASLLRQQLGLEPSASGLPVVGIDADGWLGELLAADRRIEAVPTPTGFHGELRPYQERGLGWLLFMSRVGLGACLADDMGLGKTIQLLGLLLAERQPNGPVPERPAGPRRRRRARIAPTLLVCPMSVVGNWQREAERFAPGLSVHVHHGAGRFAGPRFAVAARRADLVITTYGLATRDADQFGAIAWRRVVLDEAQNIKNPETRQSRAIRAFRAEQRIAMTGTPVENRLGELWSIMDFCNPGLLGASGRFRTRFAVPIERYRDDEAAERLRRIITPFVLRRLKTDRSIIADLPDKIEMKVYCNLTREQASLYQAVVDDMLARIDSSEGIERRGLVLATLLKLKQVCNHPAHLLGDGSRLDGRSGKLARLEEILEEALAEGDRALCFTQFAEMGHLLRAHLGQRLGTDVPFLHGGVSKATRDAIVSRFQAGDGPPVLLLSLKAGGVGLNLTAANHVVHFDRWWNPAVEEQATDRAFRIGQRRNVQVRKLVCVGTLEERIDQMIEHKRELAERVVGAGEDWLTELSTAQLRELVALSADAVAEA